MKTTTIIEASEIINKEFAGCFAYIEGRQIIVTYRGKKTEKVFIMDSKVTSVGGFNVAQVAKQIAERFELEYAN